MPDELLTVEQAAERLQLQVGTVRRLLRTQQLPGVKLGPRQWRIPLDAIKKYIARAMTSKPVIELETELDSLGAPWISLRNQCTNQMERDRERFRKDPEINPEWWPDLDNAVLASYALILRNLAAIAEKIRGAPPEPKNKSTSKSRKKRK
jgi:excisionase family DNA binding protein